MIPGDQRLASPISLCRYRHRCRGRYPPPLVYARGGTAPKHRNRSTPMSANEIVAVTRQYRQRIADLLTPGEAADYDAYEQRMQAQIDAGNVQPIEPTPAEDMVLAKIAAD